MSDTSTASYLQRLLVGYLVAAKTELDDTQYETVKAVLPGYIAVANEMVTIEVLADKSIMRHAYFCESPRQRHDTRRCFFIE